jgi:hypothetical protein
MLSVGFAAELRPLTLTAHSLLLPGGLAAALQFVATGSVYTIELITEGWSWG